MSTHLIPGANTLNAIVVRDRLTGQLTLESIAPSGEPVEYASAPSLSGDGRFLSFTSDERVAESIYVRDRVTRQSTLVRRSAGVTSLVFNSYLSVDGRYLTATEPRLGVGSGAVLVVTDLLTGVSTDVALTRFATPLRRWRCRVHDDRSTRRG